MTEHLVMHRLPYRQAMVKLALKEKEDKQAPAVGPTRAAADVMKKDHSIIPKEALGAKRVAAPVASPKTQSQDILKDYISEDGARLSPFDRKSASPEFKEAWISKYNELYGTGHQYDRIKPVDKEYISSRDQRNALYHPESANYYANIGATDVYKDGMTVSDFDSLLREQRVNAAKLHGEVSNFAERGYLNPFGWFGQKYSPIWHNTQRAIDSLSSDDPLQTMLNREARSWYGKQTGHEIKENEKHINDSERRALATSHVLARTADGMALGLLPVGSTALGLGLYGAGYTKPNGKPYNIFYGDDTSAGLYANAVYRDTGDIDLARQREAQLRLAGSGGELLGSLFTGRAVTKMLPGLSPTTAAKINSAKNLAYVTAGTDLATDTYSTVTGDTDNVMNNKVRPVVTGFAKSMARIPFLGIGASGSKIKDAATWWLYSLGQDSAQKLGEGELPSVLDAVKSGVSAATFAAAGPVGAKLPSAFSTAVPAVAATSAEWAVDTAHSAVQQRSPVYDAFTSDQVNGEAYEKRKQQIQTYENAREKYKKQLESEHPGLDTKDWTPEEVNAAYEQSVRNQATQTLQGRVLGRLADEGNVDLSSMSQEQASAWLDSVPLEKQQDAMAMEASALISSGAPVDVSLFDVNSGLMRPDQVDELFNSRVVHEVAAKLNKGKAARIWVKGGKKGLFQAAIKASPELAAEAEVYMASKVRQDFDSFHSGDAAEKGKKKNDDAQYLSAFSKEQRVTIFQNAFSGKSPDQVIDYVTASAGEGGVDQETAEAVVDSLVNTAVDTKNNPGYAGKLMLAVADKLKEGGDKLDSATRDYVIGRIKGLPPEDITKMLETADTKDWEALSSVFTAHAGDDTVPEGFTKEEWERTKPALVSGVKGLAVKKWKEDPLKNTPTMVSFWLKSQGFDNMAEFAENPMLFWGSLVLLLGGTALLGSALFGGSRNENKQPIIINNGPQPSLSNYAQSLV